MAAPDLSGTTYPPSPPYVIGREHVRAFARAVGATKPEYSDVDAARELGYQDLVAPPTYAVVLAQRCEAQLVQDPEAQIDFSRVVHGEEKFAYTRPLCAGDHVTSTLHVERMREVGGHLMVTTRVDLTVGDEPCASVTSSIIVRGEESGAA